MQTIFKNWKTTLLGGGALTAAVTAYINNPDDWKTALGLLITGLIGVIAKDHNN